MGWELTHHRGEISAVLQDRLEFGLAQSDEAIAEAYATFTETQQAFPVVTEGLDVLVALRAGKRARTRLDVSGAP